MDSFLGDINDKGVLTIDENELHHCFKVMRKKIGDKVRIINGKGSIWIAEITDFTEKNRELSLISENSISKTISYKFHLAVAPTKNADRIEWLLEKSIETGIHDLSLIYTERTERKRVNIERLNKIAVSALKQSQQLYLPEIKEFKFNDFVKNCSSKSKFIASCFELKNIKPVKELVLHDDICILIGPEGDFTEEEYQSAINNGFIPISLGTQRFRTETAALFSVMSRFAYESQA